MRPGGGQRGHVSRAPGTEQHTHHHRGRPRPALPPTGGLCPLQPVPRSRRGPPGRRATRKAPPPPQLRRQEAVPRGLTRLRRRSTAGLPINARGSNALDPRLETGRDSAPHRPSHPGPDPRPLAAAGRQPLWPRLPTQLRGGCRDCPRSAVWARGHFPPGGGGHPGFRGGRQRNRHREMPRSGEGCASEGWPPSQSKKTTEAAVSLPGSPAEALARHLGDSILEAG